MIHPKTKAGTAAAAVSGVVVWLLGRYVLHGSVDPAITAEVYVAVPAGLTFLASHFTARQRAEPPGQPQHRAPGGL